MSIINYPAIFHKENNSYWTEFPDLPGCFSNGDSILDAYNNSKEAIGLFLDKEGDKFERIINKPSNVEDIINRYPGEIVMYVEYDSIEYSKKYKNRAVKKTLSIPEWLDEIAIKNNINFSKTLKEALINKLNL